jgi:hypothetical protein
MVASARGLEFNEDESGNVLLEGRKLSPNEAISADKRAYSRAVLVSTDAVALLQDRIVGRRCVLRPLRSGSPK